MGKWRHPATICLRRRIGRRSHGGRSNGIDSKAYRSPAAPARPVYRRWRSRTRLVFADWQIRQGTKANGRGRRKLVIAIRTRRLRTVDGVRLAIGLQFEGGADQGEGQASTAGR